MLCLRYFLLEIEAVMNESFFLLCLVSEIETVTNKYFSFHVVALELRQQGINLCHSKFCFGDEAVMDKSFSLHVFFLCLRQ
jgi:hypothetical protein